MTQKQSDPKPQTGAKRAARRADARENPEQLRQNQQHLGVGPDHKTPDMKKGRRGTFP